MPRCSKGPRKPERSNTVLEDSEKAATTYSARQTYDSANNLYVTVAADGTRAMLHRNQGLAPRHVEADPTGTLRWLLLWRRKPSSDALRARPRSGLMWQARTLPMRLLRH